MIFYRISRTFYCAILAWVITAPTIAVAQITPFAESNSYEIAKVASKGFCFAAAQMRSESDNPMLYTFYKTVAGQRWHVLGFEKTGIINDGELGLKVGIDGVETLKNSTETRDGDFMLPFRTVDEIRSHEKLLDEGRLMRVDISSPIGEPIDTVTVQLENYRAALAIMNDCVQSFEK